MTVCEEGDLCGAPTFGSGMLSILAQLAASLLRAGETRAVEGAPRLGRLTADPAFSGPLAQASRSSSPIATVPLDSEFVRRLQDQAKSRLCALLICRPQDEVDRAALLVSCAIHHRDIVAVVLKKDRERMRDALGDEAMQVVTQEALLLHHPLVELGADPALRLAEERDVRGHFLTTGRRALARFLALVEPKLAEAVALRGVAGDAAPAGFRGMTERHCDHVVRLLRRRMPAWSMHIA